MGSGSHRIISLQSTIKDETMTPMNVSKTFIYKQVNGD